MLAKRIISHSLQKVSGFRYLSSQRWILKRHFEGEPKLDDFELSEKQPLKSLNDRDVLTEALFWSVDPYMRAYPKTFGMKVPMTMIGSQVAKVVESRHPDFPEGCTVVGHVGWRDFTVINPDAEANSDNALLVMPKLSKAIELPHSISKSHLLGAIGMPGNTAFFGFTEICQPQKGEVAVVSGAAGAVGSLVGQIAKIKGCHVIGIAGSDEKCSWLTKELGFDAAINYKTQSIRTSLLRAMPEGKRGVDCYFDNVGGKVSHHVMTCMSMYGRVAICGSISSYNDTSDARTLVPPLQPLVIGSQLKLEGLHASRWIHNGAWNGGLEQMRDWMEDGKIISRETIREGFENLPSVFIAMLRGENIGKMLVKA
jgi:prostaglandin reductase 1